MATTQSLETDKEISVQIPSWTELFGQNSQCECNECESMTGAPAYLAHILHFAEHCTPNEVNETPYDVMIKRVPYLPHLPLTCENTNSELPYIQVVLEILEFFAANETLKDIPAYNSDTEDWKSNYAATAKKAYQILSTQCYPFSLPYHQPLDMIRTYLAKVRTNMSELIAVFNAEGSDTQLRLLKESFALSDEAYSLLTEFKVAGAPIPINKVYGFDTIEDFQSSIFAKGGVADFLEKSGLLYAELIDILKTKFISPGNAIVEVIQPLLIKSSLPDKSIFDELKEIKLAVVDDTFESTLKPRIQTLLQGSTAPDLDPRQFKDWLDLHFDDFLNTLTIIPDLKDACNYANSKLGSILALNDSSVTNTIDDNQFKRLYLFIRLLKLTQLSIQELDSLLSPVSHLPIDAILRVVYTSQKLMQTFKLSSVQVASFNGNMSTAGTQSLYAETFLKPAFNGINGPFRPDALGNLLKDVPLMTGDKYNEVLLNAFQLLPGQLDALVKFVGIVDGTTFKLSLESVSVFYSYTLLAKSLALPLTDLLQLIPVYGKGEVLRTWDNGGGKFKEADLQVQVAFAQFVELINESAFQLNDLLYVLGLDTRDAMDRKTPDEVIKQTFVALKLAFAGIESQHAVADNVEIDEALVKSKLLSIYSKDIAAQLIGMLNDSIVYGVTLTGRPNLILPPDLKQVTYSQESGRLEVRGVLTLSNWNMIPEGGELKDFVRPIYEKPELFLKENFSEFVVSDSDRNELLGRVPSPPLSPSEKLKKIFKLLQPHVVKTLKTKTFIEKIATLISLDEDVTQIIIRSRMDKLFQSATAILKEMSTETNYFPAAPMADFKGMLASLQRTALFISKFNLNAVEISHFISAAGNFAAIDFVTVNVEQWQRINRYSQLRKSVKIPLVSFIDLFKLAAATTNIGDLINLIVVITRWNKTDIEELVAANAYTADDFKNETVLFDISQMMKIAGKSSIKPAPLALWSKTDTGFDSLTSLALLIRDAVLQQYDASERQNTEETITAGLLERQRNALVEYILTLTEIKELKIENVEELCGHFLIDVPMSSGMRTTRIRQAISSVQSFFKRCQMGLEYRVADGKQVGVLPEQIDNSVWEPKSFFRTWQVTMEFMTNPYPYLSYKYLIDKSGPAKALEATLMKSNIIARNVEEAYRVYLQQLSETSNLEIAAMYIDDSINVDGDSTTKFVHIIGKTRSTPHAYYYCSKNESDRWSFWEKIPVPIKENDGDSNGPSGAHVIFAKFRNRYYLFLPEFVPRNADADYGTASPTEQSTKPMKNLKSATYYEVKIAVSEYYEGKWTDKQYLQQSGSLNLYYYLRSPVSSYLFTHAIAKDADDKETFILTLVDNAANRISFSFKTPNAALLVSAASGTISRPPQGVFYQNLRMRQLNYPMPDDNGIPANPIPDILKETRDEKLLSFSPQYLKGLVSVYEQPFFLHDRDRSYYVKTVPIDYAVGYTYELTDKHYLHTLEDVTITALKEPTLVSYLPIQLHVRL